MVDPGTGRRETIAEVPGFARGLAFHGPYAFIGLSLIRESALFTGLSVSDRAGGLRCGIWVIDTRTGQVVHHLQFEAGIEEIFAVEVLSGVRVPEVLGFQEDTIHKMFIVPHGPMAMEGESREPSS